MTLDIRGSLKNTKLSKNPFVVFDELFSNAIDAFLVRKNADPNAAALAIEILVEISPADLMSDEQELAISCKDNGSGFGDEQTQAFLTKDTSYKDDLQISGIGQCKGAGRIQFFHHFSNLALVSGFMQEGHRFKRTLNYTEGQKQIEPDQFEVIEDDDVELGSQITLSGLRPSVRSRLYTAKAPSQLLNARQLKIHLLVSSMRRLVGLRPQLGDFRVDIKVVVRGNDSSTIQQRETIGPDDIPEVTTSCCVKVHEIDPRTQLATAQFQTLTISHYKLSADDYDLPAHAIALCAKSSPVKSITGRYLRSKTIENNPLDGYYHVILIEGDILDEKVNEQRDDFDIPATLADTDLFDEDLISLEQIFDAVDDVINEFVAPPDWSKEQIVKAVGETFGITEAMLTDTDTRIRFGDTPSTVAKRVLAKYQDRALVETAKIFDLKEAIHEVDPDSEEFREKVNELAWRHTSTLRSIDMAALSQLVVRRAAIVEILSLACKKALKVQDTPAGERRRDEKIIHSIFFPMRKDSTEVTDHDIWLLSEEYQYFHYIASDVPLARIKWDGGNDLFDSDVDEALEALMSKNEKENAGKRPDIAIFSKEGAAIIIEFKSPGEQLDDHVGDLMEYSQLLAAKSRGRLKQFYGYLIGDGLNPNRLRGYNRFPSGRGFFGTEPIIEHTTGARLGELYSEILYYDDIVQRAEARLAVFKKRLNLSSA